MKLLFSEKKKKIKGGYGINENREKINKKCYF